MIRRGSAHCLIACIFATVVAGSVTPCDAQQRLGRLLGVYDDATGQPIIGAEVVDRATGTKAVTSVSGAISLAFLEPGATVLEVRKLGYKNRMLTVKVSPDDTASITVTLVPLGQTLPEVVTTGRSTPTGKLSTFEQHRASGFGHFLTREQLVKMENHLTSDALRTIPGLRLINKIDPRKPWLWVVGTSRGTASFLRNGPSGLCLAAVMVDGIMVYSGSGDKDDLFDINSIKPEDIAGVEYYAGGATMPLELNATRATCGLVVIWTRT